jgi:hypothetical protein
MEKMRKTTALLYGLETIVLLIVLFSMVHLSKKSDTPPAGGLAVSTIDPNATGSKKMFK